MSGDHNMHCSANQPDCYGDGNVYRGVRSKDSAVKTIWVGLTDEELHLKSAAYANKRKEAYLNHLKKGLAKKLSKDMIDWIWVAHYEGYRDAMNGEKHGY